MSLKTTLARIALRKMRFAVIRPKNQSLVSDELKKLQAMKGTNCEHAFQGVLNDTLADGGIFVGYVKAGRKELYDQSGKRTGETIQPGDIFDEIPDFLNAIEKGGYQLTGRNISVTDPGPRK